ncbi:hypothetical protein [Paenibacillus senegalensis]|uniref:hypothetical protein n=1 Tax=Paenibacillus senegalensis TaxID=1465766 RepID=UPI000301AF68|nr:hypothetical protein [Paenibacillus senegalensis]
MKRPLIMKVRNRWHHFWFHYHMLLYNNCLDDGMRRRLLSKADHHNAQAVLTKAL